MESIVEKLVNDPNLNSQRVSIKDLGFEDQLRIMWGWCWRGVCVTIVALLVAMIAGGVVGGIIGFVVAILGKDIESVTIYLQLLGGAIGFVIGFMSLLPLINWLTKVDFRGFQIWLVKVPK